MVAGVDVGDIAAKSNRMSIGMPVTARGADRGVRGVLDPDAQLGATLQAKSGQKIFVEFHPHRMAGVDLGLGDPGSFATIHFVQGG
jgi:hypothetical protein